MNLIMKKYFFLAAAVVLLTSCQKSLNETDSIRREIRLGLSAIEYETKAFVESTNSTLQSNGFKAAVVIDADNSTMFNKAVVYSNGAYIVPGERYYFPNEGTVSFYGIYPADEFISIAADGKASVTYTHNSDDDLIVAKKNGVASQSDAVALEFEHLLSQVSIHVKTDDPNVVCNLHELSINDSKGGIYSFVDSIWTLNDNKAKYIFYSNTGGQTVTTTASAVGSAISLMPGEVSLNVLWKCYSKNGQQLLSNNDVTIPVTLTKGKRTAISLLLPAKASEAKVSSSVKAWNDESQNLTAETPYFPELLTSVFTVNASNKKVKFTKGNLFWNGSEFRCEEQQYHYRDVWDDTHFDHFYWSSDARVAIAPFYSNALTEFGITPSKTETFFAADGGVFKGLTVLSSDEWQYIFNHGLAKNSSSKNNIIINGKNCVVLKPDGFNGTVADSYTASEWADAESAFGLVALPFAGIRFQKDISSPGTYGAYWSTTHNGNEPTDLWIDRAPFIEDKFGSACGGLSTQRHNGNSVRLVQVQ